MATYTSAVGLLTDFLPEQGMPTDVATIRREHIESFIDPKEAQQCQARTAGTRATIQEIRSQPRPPL